jgi:glycosyltransferase involved in cell wall biosynthesis
VRILQLTPGTGDFLCGSCLRDNALVMGLRDRGHDALIAPLYLPFALEDRAAGAAPAEGVESTIHMGGINVYLQQKLGLFRWLPRVLHDRLDSPRLLRWAAGHSKMTETPGLGALTLSMLRGEEGRQRAEVARLVEWARPDMLLLSNVMLIGLARELKAALGCPVVCTMQGEAPFLDALDDDHRARCWATLAERARDVDGFLAVSQYTADLMSSRMDLDRSKVQVVWNGADLAGISPDPARRDPERPAVGYLARMCRDKGIEALVDGFLRLKQRHPRARLLAAGVVLNEDRDLLARLERRVAEAGWAADVELLGPVTREQKIDLLQRVDVLSVPAGYGESFGLFLPEAWAAGLPVVQPRHGGFTELVEHTGGGLLYDPGDPAALADALGDLLDDPARRAALGEKGRAVATDEFTRARMAERVEAALEGLVGARQP